MRRHGSAYKKRLYDYCMYGVAFLSPLALLPQIIQIYQTQQVSGLSLPSWFLLGCINVTWVIYGLIHRAHAITIANIAFGALNFSAALAIVLFS